MRESGRTGAGDYDENVGSYDGITPENAVVALVDHQVGLMNIVRDMGPDEFRNNLLGLAKTAKTLEMPVILTTALDWGPNGRILPELEELFPEV